MFKNPLIIFEGIECTGKSTQIKNVINHLKKKKIKFINIREPGGSKNSEKIRGLILNKKSNFEKMTDLLLYMASRSENINKLILKNYKKKIILIDRFIYSTLAYQHYGMGVDKKVINLLNKILLKNIKPTHIFFHKVSIVNMKKRIKNRKINNRYDNFNETFYKKVQAGFFKSLKNKKNVTIVNSNLSISDNKNLILSKINKLIK